VRRSIGGGGTIRAAGTGPASTGRYTGGDVLALEVPLALVMATTVSPDS
jgi:hypothetical protein